MNPIKPTYTYDKIEEVFRKLINDTHELANHFLHEVDLSNYKLKDEIPYCDIGVISNYIVTQKLKNLTTEFNCFFENVEDIYNNGDEEVKNFIVVGLFEGIQNIGESEIDYYFSFNKWLRPNSQKAWNHLIDFWEGKEWRASRSE